MHVMFSTDKYEWSHGKKPRGFGVWGFWFDCDTRTKVTFWVTGSSFADAKKSALAWARAKNYSFVEVAP